MERKPITVSALNKYLKYRFDNDANLQNVLLRAEISNFKRHSRGHLYFTLKDEESQIGAVMFFGNAKNLPFEPKEGDKVLVEGYVSVYEPNGTYSVNVARMTLDGVGDLFLAFEQTKKRLEALGWFDPAAKRPLPMFPSVIGVVTSPTGAAVRDIINIINRRYPLVTILIYPALVQGEGAKNSIASMIAKANRDGKADVLIVGRGGGSIEDLWAFNEEIVAQAIRASRIPIVSAVGHETDFTISDFVADLRAPTPSGAAELVVPDRVQLMQTIDKARNRADLAWLSRIRAENNRLRALQDSFVFRDPRRLWEKSAYRLLHANERLEQASPKKILDKNKEKTALLLQRAQQAFQSGWERQAALFARAADKLELLNPLAIMKKGYSVIKKEQRIVRSVTELTLGDRLETILADGTAETEVVGLRKDA
ncbi:MAG TPA: exodeoxyribonuclease VII large subunit [Candidatus Izemoplasmatales bacterium]|nr:exodeoxyribonuclease VII large subunit [Candidatus Izemoplasmatales bacterium]